MVGTVEPKHSKIDTLLWFLVGSIAIACVIFNYCFQEISLLIRTIFFLSLSSLAIFIAYRTNQGKYLWELWQESIQELRKVVWPTKKETLQTTGIVLVMVLIMGLLLWTLDSILIRLIGSLTGHSGV